jgi:hypothetical protein
LPLYGVLEDFDFLLTEFQDMLDLGIMFFLFRVTALQLLFLNPELFLDHFYAITGRHAICRVAR